MVIRLVVVVGLGLAGCRGPVALLRAPAVPECRSLLGAPLYPPALSEERLRERTELLAAAELALAADPSREAAAIWVGRRLAYLGRYRAAVDAFTRALATHPASYRLLRHRGHRYITLREFARAEADLTHAWQLAQSHGNEVEPDGLPTPGVPPRSTDHGNILYHLALAKYLQGDFAGATRVWSLDLERATNDDTRVACAYWLYLSARRAGDAGGAHHPAGLADTAARALAAVRSPAEGGMDVRENATYWHLCLVFKGALDPATLAAADGPLGLGVDKATLEYGLSMNDLLRGDAAAARVRWTRIVSETDWPAFGHVAAEAELARIGRAAPP